MFAIEPATGRSCPADRMDDGMTGGGRLARRLDSSRSDRWWRMMIPTPNLPRLVPSIISTPLFGFTLPIVAECIGHPGSICRRGVGTVMSETVLAETGARFDGFLIPA